MNLMIDLETTGTEPGCSIVAIAAVPFGMPTDILPFYQKISLESCQEIGLWDDAKTMDWWARQDPAVREEAFSGTREIINVLMEFHVYCNKFENLEIWGNGAAFDAPILAEAFRQCCLTVPWHYRNENCYRTIARICKVRVPFIPPRIKHHALEDAKAQAAHAERVLGYIDRTDGLFSED